MANNNFYIGIDPGKSGFITLISQSKETTYFSIPTIGKEVDLLKLEDIFNTLKGLRPKHCVIENVHALFGSSSKATFSFGYIVGVLETFLVSKNIPFTKVNPKKWQKEMWEGIPIQKKPSSTGKTMKTDTKKMSSIAVKRLFPKEDMRKTQRSRIDDHNKIDSLLIAEYCRRTF